MRAQSRDETYCISMKELDRIALNMDRNIQRLKERIRKREGTERSKQLLTAKQVSELLKVHVYHVYALIKEQNLPVIKVSERKYRFEKGAVEDWMRSRKGVVKKSTDKGIKEDSSVSRKGEKE